MSKLKDNLINNNNQINWLPESIGKGRFGDWLNNVQDWGLSRDRYWGTPLNIWECDCGHRHAIGSIAELKSMSDNCPDDIELHRPFIDDVLINCTECGGKMKRVLPVIDCWFDSGAMPFAQWHYPFENEELFKDNFPADFISEAVDQTRGWFYSLLAISTLLFDEPSFKNVVVLGLVQDENGQKMSKSKGNAVDPFDALATYGADAIRWYFYANSAPWLPNKFYADAVIEGQRKFMGTLWNTYAFYVLYANIDQIDPTKYKLEYDKLGLMDKWLLSKLNSIVKTVDNNLNNYRIFEPARALQEFVDELSNWYVRRSRERFWAKDMPQDKINAFMTLYTTLVTLSKVTAPFVPFMAESIYRNLVTNFEKTAPISVHLADFPEYNEQYIDPKLEENMEIVLEVVVSGRAGRNNANIKNRQPLGTMYVKSKKPIPTEFTEIIADELNVKEVIFKEDISDLTSYSFKPQMRTLGPKYGKQLNEIRQQLLEVDGTNAMKELNSTGVLKLVIAGGEIELTKEDLLIEVAEKGGYVTVNDRDVTVVLDTNLTEELIEEGFVREVVSKIQTMRKEADFEVMDKIEVYYNGNSKIDEVIARNKEEIMKEVLAVKAVEAEFEGFTKEWNINGENVVITVVKSNYM